ncbi:MULTISPECIES: fdxN element excision recombinase XisF [Calothrix]|uniref:Recombinase family protein n=2 Tax=Calothrix TaxID=1186 RepID=A0ABR8A4U5_9CYAN|nr:MULTISPECIES: fdxN element excision recombinase XisF [Calothrix]MBD2194829.1 recombinase family protein [Calothrix parietina FACHB-288]MBD2223427.1 recombinase family protein [Calothrix anomala FACHB-343]
MRVGYVRVSKFEQSDALTQQTARIEKAGCSLIFSDIESGRSDSRKNFNKMLAMCREGQIKEIAITRIDRLARSVMTIAKTIALLEKLNIKLVILDAPVEDASSPFGWFSLNQMAGLAEFESRLLQSRVNHGLEHFREQNKAYQPPFGFARVDGKYVPDLTIHQPSGKTNWAIAQEIIQYFLSQKTSLRNTIQHFIKEFNIQFSPPGLRSWLLNPVLRGHTRYNVKFNRVNPEKWDIRENTHQPLISKEVYQQIETRLRENQRLWGKNFEGATQTDIGGRLLSGQIICGSCGGKCYVHDAKRSMGLRCKRRRVYGETACSNRTAVSLKKVVDAVDAALTTRAIKLRDYVVSSQPSNQDTPEIIELKSRLEVLRKLPRDSIIEEAIDRTVVKIQQLQQQNIQFAFVGASLQKELIDTFGDVEFLEVMPDESKKDLYKKFVKEVKVLNGNVIAVLLVEILR